MRGKIQQSCVQFPTEKGCRKTTSDKGSYTYATGYSIINYCDITTIVRYSEQVQALILPAQERPKLANNIKIQQLNVKLVLDRYPSIGGS